MLREDVDKYTKLTGEDGWHVPIMKVGAYLDGYDKGLEVLDKIRAEIEQLPTKTRTNWDGCCPDIDYPEIEYVDVTKAKLLDIIDKYQAESKEEEK